MDKKTEANPAKQKPTISPEQRRTLSYVIFGQLLVIGVAIVLWQNVIADYNVERFQEELAAFGQQQQQQVTAYQQRVRAQLQTLAQRDDILALFSEPLATANGATSIAQAQLAQDLQKFIQSTSADIHSIYTYYPRQAQQQKDGGGGISFVELDMINRVEQNQVVFPEAVKIPAAQAWAIHWAVAVYGNGQNAQQPQTENTPIGVLYAVGSADSLQKQLSQYSPRLAQTQLIQSIGRQGNLQFVSVGQGNQPDYTVAVPNSHWQLNIRPSTRFVKQSRHIPWWYLALLVLLAAAAAVVALYRAKQENQRQAALYHRLDTPAPSTNITTESSDDTQGDSNLSDPLYLTDTAMEVSEEDAALVTGAYGKKKAGSQDQPPKQPPKQSHTATSTSTTLPAHIFRAYDIRGIAHTEITPAVATVIGQAVATEALEQDEKTLVIGHDARSHSPEIYESLKQGIISTGCNVIEIGLVPTPLLNFAVLYGEDSRSGVIVTASHNPKEYNGFKIIINERTLVQEDIEHLKQRIASGTFAQAKTPGEVRQQDFAEDYIDAIGADIAIDNDLHVVIDAANGAASELAPAVLQELGCSNISALYCDFDGEFPNHDPDPSVASNLQTLIETVAEQNGDLGIAFDGDGDRLVAVTRSGRILWPDQLLMLFARDVVSRNPGCDVIFDVKSTRQLNQVISGYGGRPIMWKTGHSNIKAKMRETGALLAGEFSGHIFFKERWFGFDDGIYAMARLLEIMTLRDQDLDAMLDSLELPVATPEIKVPMADEQKFSLVQQLIDKGEFESGEKTTIDGLRVDFTQGWGLVRASNTSAALTLRFEADTTEDVEQIQTLFKRELHKIDNTLTLDF